MKLKVNILNWFQEKNPNVKVTFVRKLNASIVVSVPDFTELQLSDSMIKDGSVITYEVYTMNKLVDHYTIQVFCYVDGSLVRFEDPNKFDFE